MTWWKGINGLYLELFLGVHLYICLELWSGMIMISIMVFSKSALPWVLSSASGLNLRQEAGGKRRSTGRPAGSHDSSNVFQSIVSILLVCTRLAVAVREWPGSRECDLIQRGQTLQVLWGPICWHILLNSLRLRTIQLWAPRLLRLRICDSSPGHQVQRGI